MLRSFGYTPRVTWAGLPGKPAAFPPASHTHAFGDLTGIPLAFPPAAHTHSYDTLADKPTIAALSNATPKALGTASSGTSTTAARADHVHPAPAGLLAYLGDINVTETLLLSLAVGMKRKAFPLAGVTATDRLQIIPSGAPTAGCEAINAYPASAGNVSIGYYTPLLGIGATYSIPVSIYRVT